MGGGGRFEEKNMQKIIFFVFAPYPLPPAIVSLGKNCAKSCLFLRHVPSTSLQARTGHGQSVAKLLHFF